MIEKTARVGDSAWVGGLAWVGGNAVISRDMIVTRHLSATRSDGYTFTIAPSQAGGYWITAGCRIFPTFATARAHWRLTRGDTPLGIETELILCHLTRLMRLYYPEIPLTEPDAAL